MKARHVNYGEGERGICFLCPGCGSFHSVRTVGTAKTTGPVWGHNGSLEAPTLTPSVLIRTGHYANPGEQPGECYCDFTERFPEQSPLPWKCARCHSFVIDGRIQFLADCTHALAGQTVDLPELES